MKRVLSRALLLAAVLAGVASVCAAQAGNGADGPPPPANDYFPQRWKEFASAEGRFKALFPAEPKLTTATQETVAGQIKIHSAVYKSFIEYGVVFMDFPGPIDDPDIVKSIFDAAREGGLSGVAQHKPRVLSEADITIDGHPGRLLQLDLEGKAVMRLKLAAVGPRLYIVSVTAPLGHEGALEGKNAYEKIAWSFLDSFKLTGGGQPK